MPIKKRTFYIPKNERLHLSGKLIKSLSVCSSDYHVKDDEVKKLHIKVTPSGNKSFLLRYRNVDGVERKLKLGDFPDMSVSAARRKAGEELLKISLGADPSAVKIANRQEQTFQEYSQTFIDDYAEVQLKHNTVYVYKRLLERSIIPAFGHKKLRLVSASDLLELRKNLKSTPFLSNRAVGLVRKIYNYAQQAGELPAGINPAKGIPQFKEKWRERLFSDEEMSRIGQAIAMLKVEKPAAIYAYSAIQFLFLTGCRKSEALRVRWADIDIERGILAFAETKTEPRKQVISDPLTELLRSLKSGEFSEWVFPARDANKHLGDLSKSWGTVLKRADVEHARLHDIRHTVLSDIANDTDLPTAAAIGGHRSIQSTMRYVHGRAESTNRALREAAAKKGSFLMVDPDVSRSTE